MTMVCGCVQSQKEVKTRVGGGDEEYKMAQIIIIMQSELVT